MEKQNIWTLALVIASMTVPALSYYKDRHTEREQNEKHLELVNQLMKTKDEMAAAKLALSDVRTTVAQVNATVIRLEQAKEISPQAAGAIKNALVEVVGTEVKVDTGVVDVLTKSPNK